MSNDMTIVAKSVVDNEFWILQENDIKIGNILVHDGRYQVKINNRVTEYRSQSSVENAIGVKLTGASTNNKQTTIRGYHTGEQAFNQTWDVERGLPLFTRVKSGQCWHAAGWYVIERDNLLTISECPKLIYLKRYQYAGPFLTKGEAKIEYDRRST